MELEDFHIIKAEEKHIKHMAELIKKYLGTCNIKNAQNDILSQNIAELADTIDCYQLAIDKNGSIIGLCGIGNPQNDNDYDLDIGTHRNVLYVVVDQNFQRQGVGTALIKSCIKDINDYPILYEAWGEIKNGNVNSHQMLVKCSFKMIKDMGTSYYKEHGYCTYCVNKNKNCHACYCKIYILDGN